VSLGRTRAGVEMLDRLREIGQNGFSAKSFQGI